MPQLELWYFKLADHFATVSYISQALQSLGIESAETHCR